MKKEGNYYTYSVQYPNNNDRVDGYFTVDGFKKPGTGNGFLNWRGISLFEEGEAAASDDLDDPKEIILLQVTENYITYIYHIHDDLYYPNRSYEKVIRIAWL